LSPLTGIASVALHFLPFPDNNMGSGNFTRSGNEEMALQEEQVREAIKQVIDPELFVNIVDLGLIYEVEVLPAEGEHEKNDVKIKMTMTSPMCPAGPQLVADTKKYASDLEEVNDVEVEVVMDPPWTQDMMSDDARDQLGIF